MSDCVIYCRGSGTAETAAARMSEQESTCREWADRAGLHVAGVFTDTGSSLAVKRPGLDAMLEYVASRTRAVTVLMEGPAILSRSVSCMARWKSELESAGARLQFADATTPSAEHAHPSANLSLS